MKTILELAAFAFVLAAAIFAEYIPALLALTAAAAILMALASRTKENARGSRRRTRAQGKIIQLHYIKDSAGGQGPGARFQAKKQGWKHERKAN